MAEDSRGNTIEGRQKSEVAARCELELVEMHANVGGFCRTCVVPDPDRIDHLTSDRVEADREVYPCPTIRTVRQITRLRK